LLSRYVLGVRPVAGWGRVRFDPRPGGLEYAEGTFHTSGGEAQVRWTRREAEKLDVSIVLPARVEIEIAATGERLVGPLEVDTAMRHKPAVLPATMNTRNDQS
jgi:hypothetical protein